MAKALENDSRISLEELEKVYDKVNERQFSEGLISVTKDGVQFHVDSNGEPAYQETFDTAWGFQDGLAPVKKDGKWFHIHPNGEAAYSERFEHVAFFNEGLAGAAKEDLAWFHIHPNGEAAYSERFDGVGPFYNGLARVRKGKEWFQIRPDGTRAQ